MRERLAEGTRVGLVLGAGGTVGCAYHAGVLFSLLHHAEWDARSATTIVGTSAGSLIGALLRCNVTPAGLVALTRGGDASLSDDAVSGFGVPEPASPRSAAPGEGLLEALRLAPGVSGPSAFELLRSFRPPSSTGIFGALRHRSVRPALLSMARVSGTNLRPMVAGLDSMVDNWPDRELRICTVDANSGRRRVIDGSRRIALSTAVAASCAVPGMFAPQHVGSQRLVDGGVHSSTNIDALNFEQLDEVLVIAPMAGRTFGQFVTRNVQLWVAASIRRELRAVPAGMRVRLFVPGAESSTAMGIDLMAKDRSDRTVLASFLEAGDVLSRAHVA